MAVGPQISPLLSLSVPQLGPKNATKAAQVNARQSPLQPRSTPLAWPQDVTERARAPRARASGLAPGVSGARPRVSFERACEPLKSGEMSPADWSGSLRRGLGPPKPIKVEPPSRALSDLAQHLGVEESPRYKRMATPSKRRMPEKKLQTVPKMQPHASPFPKRKASPQMQPSNFNHFTDRDFWEFEAHPSAEPSGVPYVEASEVSDSLPDMGYNWPSEQFEPLGSMIRSLEFQVGALFELMDAHSAEADASVLEVINRKREAVHDTFQALKEAVWWTRRRKERNTPTGSVLARPQRIGYSCHGDLAGANDRTALRNDRSGLLELEALQSQLDVKISQVLEEDSRELPAMPVRPATPGLPAPSTRSSAPCALNLSVPNPPAAGLEGAPATDLASSHWFKELQASWTAGAAAAKPPVSAPGTGDLKEVTMEPVAEPLKKTSGLEGLVLTPTYFHFRSDE